MAKISYVAKTSSQQLASFFEAKTEVVPEAVEVKEA
jgi:hypothetical protein